MNNSTEYTTRLSNNMDNAGTLRLPRTVCRFLLGLLLLIPGVNVFSQKAVDYSIHANIIYHFTKYVNWPPQKQTGDFVIGVVGESQIFSALESSLSNKKAGSQRIVVKALSASSSFESCHIVFLCDEESYLITKIAEKTIKTNTLIVSESEGMARKGSCINFTIVADRLKLEISRNNIEKRKLNIASELLQLGKIID